MRSRVWILTLAGAAVLVAAVATVVLRGQSPDAPDPARDARDRIDEAAEAAHFGETLRLRPEGNALPSREEPDPTPLLLETQAAADVRSTEPPALAGLVLRRSDHSRVKFVSVTALGPPDASGVAPVLAGTFAKLGYFDFAHGSDLEAGIGQTRPPDPTAPRTFDGARAAPGGVRPLIIPGSGCREPPTESP